MDKAESHSGPADRGQNLLVAKRTASEEPNTAPNAKRIEVSHDRLTKPDIQPPATTWRDHFLEKVY